MTSPMSRPGWYPDPSGTPGQRYWDGRQWTHHAPPPSIVINNTVGVPAPVIIASGPNHALHLILTLLTCGLWLPVWLIVAVVGHSRVRVAGQSSNTPLVVGAVIGGLVLLGLAVEHPVALIPLAVLAVLGYLGYQRYERALERRAEQERLAARADAENQAFMSGDPSAMYGQYPPPFPPPYAPEQA
jgi:Protein of unknown function (DUF2510)